MSTLQISIPGPNTQTITVSTLQLGNYQAYFGTSLLSSASIAEEFNAKLNISETASMTVGTASYALNDGNGNEITSTYVRQDEVSGLSVDHANTSDTCQNAFADEDNNQIKTTYLKALDGIIKNSSDADIIDLNQEILLTGNQGSLEWGTRFLLDSSHTNSLGWQTRELYTSLNESSLNWEGRYLNGGWGADTIGAFGFYGAFFGDGSGITGIIAEYATNDSDGNPINSTYVKNSDVSTLAVSSATIAGYADTAGSATTANTAGSTPLADYAESCNTANEATRDGTGNVIDTTYVKNSDVSTLAVAHADYAEGAAYSENAAHSTASDTSNYADYAGEANGGYANLGKVSSRPLAVVDANGNLISDDGAWPNPNATSIPVYSFSTLPAGFQGMIAAINDAGTHSPGSTAVGGGSDWVPIVCDGSSVWRCLY